MTIDEIRKLPDSRSGKGRKDVLVRVDGSTRLGSIWMGDLTMAAHHGHVRVWLPSTGRFVKRTLDAIRRQEQ